jgi:tetratricopeptide (TPR) repeat protein
MARGQSFANLVAMGFTCANDADAPWARGAVARLEPLAAEAVKLPGVLADDRAGLHEQLVLARKKAGDEPGARQRAEDWWAFLVAERASGKSADARTMLDSWIVGAALALHDPGRAVPLLQASEAAAPGDYNPPYRLAVLYLEAKNLDQALAASDRALRLAYGPRKVRVLSQRATIQEAKGDLAGARASLREAVAYAKALPKAQQNPRLVERLEARIAKLPGG